MKWRCIIGAHSWKPIIRCWPATSALWVYEFFVKDGVLPYGRICTHCRKRDPQVRYDW